MNSALFSRLVPFAVAIALVAAAACDDGGSELTPGPISSPLSAYENPFQPGAPGWAPQPHRDKPRRVVASADGRRAWVSLPGTPDDPGRRVAVIDVAAGGVRHVGVGDGPAGLALHPAGRLLVVTHRYSDYLAVLDTRDDSVTQRLPAMFYTEDAVFTPDGETLWLANRWKDAVMVLDVRAHGAQLEVAPGPPAMIPVGANPTQVVASPSGETIAVASPTGLSVSLLDRRTRTERHRVDLGAPANGIVFVGERWLVVATLSASTHHPALSGPDGDGDGTPGDGTPNVNFQDLQNELAVVAVDTGQVVWRYTSDTLCCRDYRDVDPRDLARHGDLLPPADRWIVGGALPEQLAWDGQDTVYVAYSGSDEIQAFTVSQGTGALSPGPVWPAGGHAPHGLALAGEQLLVAHRLGETVGVLDRHTGAVAATLAVGDLSRGPFPATDAEIGELLNFVTAPFSVDGDQTCAHCHQEGGNINKAFSMPLTRYPGLGLRMTMAYRGAADTRPWFMEAAMDQHNFKPVLNEFARIENFCCSDYTQWPDGAPAGCVDDPPAACAGDNPGSSNGFDASRAPGLLLHPRPTARSSRDTFFLDQAQAVVGRRESFGDGLFFEHPITGERRPIALDFEGATRALGLFLMTAPRLPPNPNPGDSVAARRGKAIFEGLDTGCATCHPAPTFAASTDVNPFGVPLRMGPVISPLRDAAGRNMDLLASGFIDAFPRAEVDSCEEICGAEACAADAGVCDALRNTYFGVPTLRGLWDRAPRLLHDGRARGLREALCTPGHPALAPGERGYNERDGVFDTHGGTSHLSEADISYLITYLLSL